MDGIYRLINFRNFFSGLFHRGISESGTATCIWALSAASTHKENREKLAAEMGCPTQPSSELISCLRNVDAEKIIRSTPPLIDKDGGLHIPFGPVVESAVGEGDEMFISATPLEAIRSTPGQHLVPWMAGFTSGDGAILAANGSTRRADIIIIDRQKDKGVILDPTIRFEMHEQQPQEVCREKQVIYEPCCQHLGAQYHITHWTVFGLMFGARMYQRGTLIKKLDEDFENIIVNNFLSGSKETQTERRETAKRIREFYFGDKPINKDTRKALAKMYTDVMLGIGTDSAVKLHSKARASVYYYHFDYRGRTASAQFLEARTRTTVPQNGDLTSDLERGEEELAGVCHMDELMYLFPQDHMFPNSTKTKEDDEMVDIMTNIWTNFARTGRLRWAGHVARMGESRNAYRVLVGRPEGKRPLGRPRRRWEDNIKMDLREVGYDDRDWINLAQDRDQWRAYVRAAMNLRVP
ncbi:hypothetical protein ANN_13645 [Periplaneta americana]|uniref:Carboxylesterase type B domain-containing protein n=1 Tax=Periplaneta americana TaxID=6978 RepID=A0ABQ8TM65_PERAM|nr:hypothetical protein ANN_13645 [Periplaneta americana]